MAKLSHLWLKRKLRTVSLPWMDNMCSIMRINIGRVQLSLDLVCQILLGEFMFFVVHTL
jgi:hypothetical protein